MIMNVFHFRLRRPPLRSSDEELTKRMQISARRENRMRRFKGNREITDVRAAFRSEQMTKPGPNISSFRAKAQRRGAHARSPALFVFARKAWRRHACAWKERRCFLTIVGYLRIQVAANTSPIVQGCHPLPSRSLCDFPP